MFDGANGALWLEITEIIGYILLSQRLLVIQNCVIFREMEYREIEVLAVQADCDSDIGIQMVSKSKQESGEVKWENKKFRGRYERYVC